MSSAATSVRQVRPFAGAPVWLCMVGAADDDDWDDMEIASSKNRYYVQKYGYAASHDTDETARCQSEDPASQDHLKVAQARLQGAVILPYRRVACGDPKL